MKRTLISTAVLALGGTGLVATATSAQAASHVIYKDCDAVRAAGKAPLYAGQYGYRAGLDANHNGIACEPSGYVPRTASKPATAPVKPAPMVAPPAKPALGKTAPGTPKPTGPAMPAPGAAKPLPVVAPTAMPAPSAPMGPKVSTDLVTPKQDGRNTGVVLLTAGALAGLGAVRLRAGKR